MRKAFFQSLSSRFTSNFASFALTLQFSTSCMVSAEEDLKRILTRLCLYTDADILYGGILVSSASSGKIHCHLILTSKTSKISADVERAKMRIFFQEGDWKWISKFMDRKNSSPWNLKQVDDPIGWCRYICTQNNVKEERVLLNVAKRRSARSQFCKSLKKLNLLKKQKIDFSDLRWRIWLGPLYKDARQHNIKPSTASTPLRPIENMGPADKCNTFNKLRESWTR